MSLYSTPVQPDALLTLLWGLSQAGGCCLVPGFGRSTIWDATNWDKHQSLFCLHLLQAYIWQAWHSKMKFRKTSKHPSHWCTPTTRCHCWWSELSAALRNRLIRFCAAATTRCLWLALTGARATNWFARCYWKILNSAACSGTNASEISWLTIRSSVHRGHRQVFHLKAQI